MRELKFRAWDTIGKKFLDPWPDGFAILGETTCFDLITYQMQKAHPDMLSLETINHVVIQQFTGLKDRNDKEIYEGDILKLQACDMDMYQKWLGVVEFGNPNGEYNWGFQLNPISEEKVNPSILLWVATEQHNVAAEIIGNIYEHSHLLNPELLKETK